MGACIVGLGGHRHGQCAGQSRERGKASLDEAREEQQGSLRAQGYCRRPPCTLQTHTSVHTRTVNSSPAAVPSCTHHRQADIPWL